MRKSSRAPWFLSRAQLDCNYHYYSEELKEAAAKCTKHDLGENMVERL